MTVHIKKEMLWHSYDIHKCESESAHDLNFGNSAIEALPGLETVFDKALLGPMKQLVGEVRTPIPCELGKPTRLDDEYVRNSVRRFLWKLNRRQERGTLR